MHFIFSTKFDFCLTKETVSIFLRNTFKSAIFIYQNSDYKFWIYTGFPFLFFITSMYLSSLKFTMKIKFSICWQWGEVSTIPLTYLHPQHSRVPRYSCMFRVFKQTLLECSHKKSLVSRQRLLCSHSKIFTHMCISYSMVMPVNTQETNIYIKKCFQKVNQS